MVYGKIPPQAKDLEEAILGAMMIDQGAFADVTEIFSTPETFYVESHRQIFRAMIQLAQCSQPIDCLTVTEELRKNEELDLVGGSYYVTKLTNAVVSAANIKSHCRIVVQKFIQREIIRVCGEMIGMAYHDSTDAFDLMDQAETDIFAIRQQTIKNQFQFLDSVLVRVIQKLEDLRHRDIHLTGVTSGFKDMDYVTCGWQKKDLIILAARPSVGKTAFSLVLATNAAKESKKAVAIFSLEMTAEKLAERMLASESDIWLWKIINARMEDENMKQLYEDGVRPLGPLPIIIDDTQSIPIAEFRAKARRMVAKHNVGLIIVDYLQLMTAPANFSNREQAVSHISRELKAAAKELNVPIIALAQLSREIEKGKSREPQLSDIRESGAIEQDADMVMFLWAPSPEEVAADPTMADSVLFAIKKHRNGAHARFIGKFKKEIQRWTYVTLTDENIKPVPLSSWKPLKQGARLVDFTAPKREQGDNDTPEDLPF